jgi:hypothetical protein
MVWSRTSWRVQDPPDFVELALSNGAPDGGAVEQSLHELRRLIPRLKHGPSDVRRALLSAYASLHVTEPIPPSTSFDAGDARVATIGDELLRAVRGGALVLRRSRPKSLALPVDIPDEPLGPEAQPTAWIEIRVADEAGKALPNIDYKIECPDGRVRVGSTNASGIAREEGLVDGTCQVTFPGLDQSSWRKA